MGPDVPSDRCETTSSSGCGTETENVSLISEEILLVPANSPCGSSETETENLSMEAIGSCNEISDSSFVPDSATSTDSSSMMMIKCTPKQDRKKDDDIHVKYRRLKKRYKLMKRKYNSTDTPDVDTDLISDTETPPKKHKISSNGKKEKKRRKMLACLYCDKLLSHRICDHLFSQHEDEAEVAAASAAKGQDRKKKIRLIKNKGNFKHNVTKISNNDFDIIVAKTPKRKEVDGSQYLPCIYCLTFCRKDELWRHTKTCMFCPVGEDPLRTTVQAKSRLMLSSAVMPESSNIHEADMLLQKLATQRDAIGSQMVRDTLIIRFGQVLLDKLGIRRKNNISQRMRQLMRLKLEINKVGPLKIDQLCDVISGKYFDQVLNAVKSLAGLCESEEGVSNFKKPGLALRIGHNLNKASQIKFGMALRKDDSVAENESVSFTKLMNNEWCDNISTIALATLKTNKFNKPDILPLTEDLVTLKKYLSNSMKTLTETLKENPQREVWRELAEATMSRIILLNKRRGSESSKLLLSAYENRPNWKTTANQEILNSLTELERQMFSRVDMVQSQGKMNKKVTTLLTNDMRDAIDVLIANRTTCGIKNENKYIFANWENGPLESWQTLQSSAMKAGCKNSELITSNTLRKYISTVCQIMDLTKGENEWLCSHLAHTVKTHDTFYKYQEATVEIAKVSKLLLASESGTIGKYKGKTLNDINLEDMDMKDDDNHVDDNNDQDMNNDDMDYGVEQVEEDTMDHELGEDENSGSDSEVTIPVSKRIKNLCCHKPVISSDDDDNNNVASSSKHNVASSSKHNVASSSKEKLTKKRWSEKEKKIFKQFFQDFIKKKQMPSGIVLRKAQKSLPDRSMAVLRTRIHNIITGKQIIY